MWWIDFMCKMPFYGKIIQEGHLQSAKFRNKGKFRMPKEKKKKKNWVPVSLGRFLSLLSRYLRQHFLRQVWWQPAGYLWPLIPSHELRSL